MTTINHNYRKRNNPVRMATKWKLVPTKNHKQCASTSCEVYIGNGCRKCPKCSFAQPFSKKRKKNGNINTPKKKLKKEEKPDGNIMHRYRAGDRVYVFWTRYKTWAWGTIGNRHGFKPSSSQTPNCRIYTVSVLGVCDGPNPTDEKVSYYIGNVRNSHLKVRKSLYKGDGSEKKCHYFDISMLTKPNDNAGNTIYPIRNVEDDQEEMLILKPSCECSKCVIKYYNNLNPTMPLKIFKGFEILGLKIGSIVAVSDSNMNIDGEPAEITAVYKCANPEYSFFKAKTLESKKSFTGKQKNKKYWRAYDVQYEDNGWNSYGSKDSHDVVSHVLDNFVINTHPNVTFTHRMNNYTYNIHFANPANIDWTNLNGVVVGWQENTESNVRRNIRLVAVTKPKPKQIEDYIPYIEKTTGKHDGKWLNRQEIIKRYPYANHDKYTLLGGLKLNRADNRKALDERLAWYKSFGIECSIQKLYHGTFHQHVFPIVHPMGGFAMASESNGKAYGQGIYFAENPQYVINNGYAPSGNNRLRVILCSDVIVGKLPDTSTHSSQRNADVCNGSSMVTFDSNDFELTGGSASGTIRVVYYDKAKTDIHLTDILWYR